ncbi:MAG: toll/interleukin-1 receptor domain-containing protein [bacterium]|nr:toll/interleukin-1 receptor domain-containing protein [bacterium]
MIKHFANPNVKITGNEFVGCCRFAALHDNELPVNETYLYDPRIVNSNGVLLAASLLAPDSFESEKSIYRKKDRHDIVYQGNSQDFAYLLTLINRSRSIKVNVFNHDIWCTGTISIKDKRHPILRPIDTYSFDIKLRSFLSKDNADNVFIVSDLNMKQFNDETFNLPDINIVSLDKYETLYSGKSIITVQNYELKRLIDIVFEQPQNISSNDSEKPNLNGKEKFENDRIYHRKLKVFLSYSHIDKPIIRDLYKKLNKQWIDVWFDEEKLFPGQNWSFEIQKAINSSDVIIVCLSSQSINKRGYLQKEIEFALDVADEQPEGAIFVIPFKLNRCHIPQRLCHLHYVNFFNENGFERLLFSLGNCAIDLKILQMGDCN